MSFSKHTESDNSPAHDDDLKAQVISSIAWLGGMKYLGQIISWIITIMVIRILDPGDYGLMAMASVCINFLVMISELGLGAAIVQKEELREEQLSHIFGFIILSHGFLFFVLLCVSHLLARYFSEPRLVLILQVLSVNFLLLALYVIPQSMIIRKMDFKRKSVVDLVGTVAGASFILSLALRGYGVWALVGGTVLMHLVRLIGYNIVFRTLILPSFSLKGIRDFASFGAYTLGSRVLWYFYSKADIFISGRVLGNQLLGIYSVALELSQIPMDKFMPIINQVAFPAYSRIQSDKDRVASHFLKAARVGSVLVFPVFWGGLTVAPEILDWLLGDKWADIILPVQIICVIMPFRALGTLVSPMLFGIGRVDVTFLYVAIASVLMPLSFLIGVQYGIEGICFAWVIGYMVIFFITLKLSLRLIGISVSDYLSNISVAIFASLIMMSGIFGIKYLLYFLLPAPLIACILIVLGVSIYCLSLFLMKKEGFYEVWTLVPGNEKMEAFMRKISV